MFLYINASSLRFVGVVYVFFLLVYVVLNLLAYERIYAHFYGMPTRM